MTAIVNPANILDPLQSTGDDGNTVVYYGSAVCGVLGTGDKVRPCRVAAGTKIHRVVVKNPDMDAGANLVFGLGIQAIDGSAQVSGDATAIITTGQATWQAAATTTYEVFPPFLVTKDSYLEALIGTGGATNTGTIYAKVEGEALGSA